MVITYNTTRCHKKEDHNRHILKMEAIRSSERLTTTYNTIWRFNQGHSQHLHRHENKKSVIHPRKLQNIYFNKHPHIYNSLQTTGLAGWMLAAHCFMIRKRAWTVKYILYIGVNARFMRREITTLILILVPITAVFQFNNTLLQYHQIQHYI
jgi:hypothetical protein